MEEDYSRCPVCDRPITRQKQSSGAIQLICRKGKGRKGCGWSMTTGGRKPGRQVQGDRKLTSAEKQRNYRERKKVESYRWVRVINTKSRHGGVAQLISTTMDEDRRSGLDAVILKHRLQIQMDYPDLQDEDIEVRWVTYMSSDGKMSSEVLQGKGIEYG